MKDLQRALLRALSSSDPLDALEKESATLPPGDRKLIASIDPDGFTITSLLVRKLRFERVCFGDDALRKWFDRDPGGFTDAFKAYGSDEPPRDYFPADEARRFKTWCKSKEITELPPADPV